MVIKQDQTPGLSFSLIQRQLKGSTCVTAPEHVGQSAGDGAVNVRDTPLRDEISACSPGLLVG